MPEAEKHPVHALSKRERNEVLAHGVLVFAATSAMALAAASRAGPSAYAPSPALTVPYFLVLFFLATAFLLFFLRASKKGGAFELLFTIAILSGAWFLADLVLPEGPALLAGSAVILLRFTWKSALVQNATLAVGVAGIAAALGSGLSPNGLLIVLTVLVFYDIVAVYKTRHMVRMFRDLVSRGVLFAFSLVPLRKRPLLAPVSGPSADPSALLLGTGDVALPVMFAVSAAQARPVHGIMAAAGAALGFVLMFRLFTAQARRAPMPALPPIALGAVLGYFLSILLFP